MPPNTISEDLHDFSMKKRVSIIVILFIIVNLTLLGLNFLQSDIMNSVRSYVRGEGLWGKAQKDAVLHLNNYAHTFDIEEYQHFLQSLKIPLGDSRARLTLQSKNPNYEVAFKGFIDGANHPKDIPGVISFFNRFQNFPYMREAIEIWTEADNKIKDLKQLGNEIYKALNKNQNANIKPLLTKLNNLNKELSKLEYDFSYVLSQGARWVRDMLWWTSIILVATMLVLVLAVSRYIMKSIEKAEKDLIVSEHRFKSLYRTDMLGILDWHQDGRILSANDAFLNMIGYTQEDVANYLLNWHQLTPKSFYRRDQLALSEIQNKGFCNPYEKELLHKDGSLVPIYLGAALLDGERNRGICFIVNQSAQKQAQKSMQLSATVFDASSNGIVIADDQKKIITVNKAFLKMSGYSENELKNESLKKIRIFDNNHKESNKIWKELDEEFYADRDVYLQHHNGSPLAVHLSIRGVFDKKDKLSHFVSIYTDMSERKAYEKQLLNIAHYDHLTGLVSRSLFEELLDKAINRANRNNKLFAIMFVDLDGFKAINDKFGHKIGDKLLKQVASRLKDITRKNDTIARIGGDEFIIMIEDINCTDSASVSAKKIIKVISSSFLVEKYSLNIGCSIGISIFPTDASDSGNLLMNADRAMYVAKKTGRGKYEYFKNLC